MKHFKPSHVAFLISTFALLASCTKTTQVTEVQPGSTGTMIGTVSLREMDGAASSSSGGVDVTIIGTGRHATTDSTGHFAMDSLPAGYYQLRYSKPGFSTYIMSEPQPFAGADTLWLLGTAPILYRINNWRLTLAGISIERYIRPGVDTTMLFEASPGSITLSDSTGNSALLQGRLLPSTIFFLGQTPNINYLDTTSYFKWQNTIPNMEPTILSLNRDVFPNDTIYLVAYPVSGITNPVSEYYSGEKLIYNFGPLGPPSNVVKLVLP